MGLSLAGPLNLWEALYGPVFYHGFEAVNGGTGELTAFATWQTA